MYVIVIYLGYMSFFIFGIILAVLVVLYYKRLGYWIGLRQFSAMFLSLLTIFQGLRFACVLSANFLQDTGNIGLQLINILDISIESASCLKKSGFSDFDIAILTLAPISMTWLAIDQVLQTIGISSSTSLFTTSPPTSPPTSSSSSSGGSGTRTL